MDYLGKGRVFWFQLFFRVCKAYSIHLLTSRLSLSFQLSDFLSLFIHFLVLAILLPFIKAEMSSADNLENDSKSWWCADIFRIRFSFEIMFQSGPVTNCSIKPNALCLTRYEGTLKSQCTDDNIWLSKSIFLTTSTSFSYK